MKHIQHLARIRKKPINQTFPSFKAELSRQGNSDKAGRSFCPIQTYAV
ncbi:hypothetical protein [Neisseria polysaccharea]|nr:hypothetical protein [Neisseria polysaccharea]